MLKKAAFIITFLTFSAAAAGFFACSVVFAKDGACVQESHSCCDQQKMDSHCKRLEVPDLKIGQIPPEERLSPKGFGDETFAGRSISNSRIYSESLVVSHPDIFHPPQLFIRHVSLLI